MSGDLGRLDAQTQTVSTRSDSADREPIAPHMWSIDTSSSNPRLSEHIPKDATACFRFGYVSAMMGAISSSYSIRESSRLGTNSIRFSF